MTEKRFDNFYDAWWYLNTTDTFWHENLEELFACRDEKGMLYNNMFYKCLNINVQKVNPENNEIDDNEELNTKTEVWLECGEPFLHEGKIYYGKHNIEYDCGGDTFEKAIIELANIVARSKQ